MYMHNMLTVANSLGAAIIRRAATTRDFAVLSNRCFLSKGELLEVDIWDKLGVAEKLDLFLAIQKLFLEWHRKRQQQQNFWSGKPTFFSTKIEKRKSFITDCPLTCERHVCWIYYKINFVITNDDTCTYHYLLSHIVHRHAWGSWLHYNNLTSNKSRGFIWVVL